MSSETDLREYAGRDWQRIESEDRAYWVGRYRQFGGLETLRASQALWQHMKTVRPDWPTEADRAADLAHHIQFKALLDRASRAFANI